MNSSKAWILSTVLLIWAIGASVIGAYYYLEYTGTDHAYNSLLEEYNELTGYETILANIGLDYGNGTIVWQNQTSIPFNITALAFTNVTFGVDADYFPGLGYFINGIDGIQNNASGNNSYWMWDLNGGPAETGADAHTVKFGDVIFWTYTSFGP